MKKKNKDNGGPLERKCEYQIAMIEGTGCRILDKQCDCSYRDNKVIHQIYFKAGNDENLYSLVLYRCLI